MSTERPCDLIIKACDNEIKALVHWIEQDSPLSPCAVSITTNDTRQPIDPEGTNSEGKASYMATFRCIAKGQRMNLFDIPIMIKSDICVKHVAQLELDDRDDSALQQYRRSDGGFFHLNGVDCTMTNVFVSRVATLQRCNAATLQHCNTATLHAT